MSITANILTIAPSFQLSPSLIAAISEVESGGIVGKVRYEPNWTYFESPDSYAISLGITVESETLLQKFSWGPMQVMGSVARQHGFRGYLPMLASDYLGVYYGCVHLNWLMQRHGYLGDDLISAYNAGTPKKDAHGVFMNQRYVKQVNQWVEFFLKNGVHENV